MKQRQPNLGGRKFLYFLETLIPLLLLWTILSGIFEAKFLAYGLISCLIISVLSLKVLLLGGLKTNNHYYTLHFNVPKMIVYTLWLIKEIIKSSLYVSKVVLFKREELNPHIVWFKADYDHPAARALLANSITLTPGTITVDIYDDGVYSVHALTDSAAEGLLDGTMQYKVAKVYNETIDYRPVEVKLDMSLKHKEPARIKNRVFTGYKSLRRLERR